MADRGRRLSMAAGHQPTARLEQLQVPIVPARRRRLGDEGEHLFAFLSGGRLVTDEECGPAPVLGNRTGPYTTQRQPVECPRADDGSAFVLQEIQQLAFAPL